MLAALSRFIRCACASLQRGRGQRIVFEVGADLVLLLCDWFLSEHVQQAKVGLGQLDDGRASYSIATPAKVASGSRPGAGGHLRRRTIGIAAPQHGQRKVGRGFTPACTALGTTLSTRCSSVISRWLLG